MTFIFSVFVKMPSPVEVDLESKDTIKIEDKIEEPKSKNQVKKEDTKFQPMLIKSEPIVDDFKSKFELKKEEVAFERGIEETLNLEIKVNQVPHHPFIKSELTEMKTEIKNEVKEEPFADFESREQMGIDFITSEEFHHPSKGQ